MSATLPSFYPSRSLLWARAWHSNRFLVGSTLFCALLFFATLGLSLVDTRQVAGAYVWIKPIKFALSSMLYCGTLAWMLTYVQGRERLVTVVSRVTAFALLIEMALIIFQAARGVGSHFNFSSSLDAALYSGMGLLIMVIWSMNLLAAWLLLRQRLQDGALAWSLRLALLLTAVGAGTGYLMTRPTSEQMTLMETGQIPSVLGAHSVGVADGGAGLPFTGWSTEGGDLRIAHFVGLHALQVLPLAGFFINRLFGRRLDGRRRSALVWIVGLTYLGFIVLLLWQALRGQPVIAPDIATVTALASLIAVGGGSTMIVFATAPARS